MNTSKKNFGFKIIVRAAAVLLAGAFIGTAQAQNLPGSPTGAGLGGFVPYGTNYVTSYVDYTGTNTVQLTNSAFGFTNVIGLGTTVTSNLFSAYNPGVAGGYGITNAGFFPNTNGGIISTFPARFVSLQIGGTLVSNGIPVTGAVALTNVLTFAKSVYQNPNSLQVETVPSLTLSLAYAGSPIYGGLVQSYTNIEVDAAGALQLASWQFVSTNANSAYSITNPFVKYRLTSGQQ